MYQVSAYTWLAGWHPAGRAGEVILGSVEAEAEFLDRVYEAAVAPDLWPEVLARCQSIFGASEALLANQNEDSCESEAIHVGADPAAPQLYASYFVKCNPLLKTADTQPSLPVLTDEHRLEKQAFMRTEYYNDFLRRFDLHSLLWVRLAIDLPHTTTITLARSRRSDAFDNADIATARRLQPHLIRAHRVSRQVLGARELQNTCDTLLDGSAHAVFVLDPKGVVRHANLAAEALVTRKEGVTLRGGILCTHDSNATRRLRGLVAMAADAATRSSGSMALPRPERQPLSIIVTPVKGDRLIIFGMGFSVVVSVIDPESHVPVPLDRLSELFGLTPAETRIAAALLTGADQQAVAKRLGLSFFTVRNHLVRIFEKTRTQRQSELIGLLTRALAN
jgi:DNA-binding CsgD family transcriptional regulator/PAS domain-containing protein